MGLIRRGEVVDDSYRYADGDAELPAGDVVVDLARLLAEGPALSARDGKIGVRVPGGTEAAALADQLAAIDLIVIEFPKYTDGRGYSLARRLRRQYGFKGELRAGGDVLRDQLFFMQRCGFDAFELKSGKDTEGALEAFREFSVTYQGAADDPRPLFRRR